MPKFVHSSATDYLHVTRSPAHVASALLGANLVFSLPFGGRYRSAEAASATASASALQAQATLVKRQIDMLADQDVAASDNRSERRD